MQSRVLTPKESNKFHFFTSIWMVPLGALLISIWLVYQYYADLGTEVGIYFEKSAGLKAGHSQIKYKDIVVGKVKDIVLDGDGVLVVAEINKGIEKLVNKNTQFWIVKPEIGLSGISGLDTLFSGAYISMYSEGRGAFVSEFDGLESAYYSKEDVNFFQLRASPQQNISQGTSIYYNGVPIGKVRRTTISADGTAVDVLIHIESDYLPYVHKRSQFWLTDFINVNLSSAGLDVKVAPLSTLVSGGIVLSTLGKGHNMSVPSDFVFTLYESEHDSQNQLNTLGQGGEFIQTFQINTTQNVAKLSVGASVDYQGYHTGKVLDVSPVYDKLTRQVKTTILLSVDTSVFAIDVQNIAQAQQAFYQAIDQGLRVSIDEQNPITGALFVELAFEDNPAKQRVVPSEPYPILPSIAQARPSLLGSVTQLTGQLSVLLSDNESSINSIASDLATTMTQIKALTAQPEFTTLPKQLTLTMQELSDTLNAAKNFIKRDQQSVLADQVTQMLKGVTEAAQQLEAFLDLLNRQPNALIFGEDE